MPHCLNNPKRIYKGTEPSPKGLGFCASGEKEGKKMKGKDDNMWEKIGIRWVKISNTNKKETPKVIKKQLTNKFIKDIKNI